MKTGSSLRMPEPCVRPSTVAAKRQKCQRCRDLIPGQATSGGVKAVSPGAVTNADFTRTLAQVLGRPALLPVPAPAVNLAFGEMGCATLLASARVQPARLLTDGF